MSERRRQSKAFRMLDDEQFAEYRRLCTGRQNGGAGWTLARIAEWLAERGCKASASMVARDADWFNEVAERLDQVGRATAAARQITEQIVASGGVANLQQATAQVYMQAVLDYVVRKGTITDDDVTDWSKLGATIARLTDSAVRRDQAESVRRKLTSEVDAAAAKSKDGKLDRQEIYRILDESIRGGGA